MIPDMVIVGHIAHDLQADGSYQIGGTVTYAGILAYKMGLRVGIVTSATVELCIKLQGLLPNAIIMNVASSTDTVFENRYIDGKRQQIIHSRASIITADAVPNDWQQAQISLLAPIANEVDPSVAMMFVGKYRVVTPQGWLRDWDNEGLVFPMPWRNSEYILPFLDIIILSTEDLATIVPTVNDRIDLLQEWSKTVSLLVLTDGPNNATYWFEGVQQEVPAFAVQEIDPTGAGDIFAVAVLIALRERKDMKAIMMFAHAAAACVIQSPGISGIPDLVDIAAFLNDHTK